MTSQLLDHLPAIYRNDPFLSRGILAFERVLLSRIDNEAIYFPEQGLEEKIEGLATLFDPQQTPVDFLNWLAGWTALSLRGDLPEQTQRRFIANAIQNYRFRGTRASLQNLLEIFLVGTPIVTEEFTRPHFFRVTISFPSVLQGDPEALGRQLSVARSIIELEKPAHTEYALEPLFPSLQIGERSTIGVDTLLGAFPETAGP